MGIRAAHLAEYTSVGCLRGGLRVGFLGKLPQLRRPQLRVGQEELVDVRSGDRAGKLERPILHEVGFEKGQQVQPRARLGKCRCTWCP